MITLEQFWMGRDRIYKRELTNDIAKNALVTVERVNRLLEAFGESRDVTSGWRPPAVNAKAGGAKGSNHQLGKAVDLADPTGSLDRWCLDHLDVLRDIGLWLEHPGWTDGWCHLQTVPPRSGARVFVPSDADPMTTIYGRAAVFDPPGALA